MKYENFLRASREVKSLFKKDFPFPFLFIVLFTCKIPKFSPRFARSKISKFSPRFARSKISNFYHRFVRSKISKFSPRFAQRKILRFLRASREVNQSEINFKSMKALRLNSCLGSTLWYHLLRRRRRRRRRGRRRRRRREEAEKEKHV